MQSRCVLVLTCHAAFQILVPTEPGRPRIPNVPSSGDTSKGADVLVPGQVSQHIYPVQLCVGVPSPHTPRFLPLLPVSHLSPETTSPTVDERGSHIQWSGYTLSTSSHLWSTLPALGHPTMINYETSMTRPTRVLRLLVRRHSTASAKMLPTRYVAANPHNRAELTPSQLLCVGCSCPVVNILDKLVWVLAPSTLQVPGLDLHHPDHTDARRESSNKAHDNQYNRIHTNSPRRDGREHPEPSQEASCVVLRVCHGGFPAVQSRWSGA